MHFSTSKQVGSGPDHGDNWMTWIAEFQVKQCDFALVLLTPASIQKPWIVWETGAVHGAAMMLGEGGRRKVRPLVFQVTDEQGRPAGPDSGDACGVQTRRPGR